MSVHLGFFVRELEHGGTRVEGGKPLGVRSVRQEVVPNPGNLAMRRIGEVRLIDGRGFPDTTKRFFKIDVTPGASESCHFVAATSGPRVRACASECDAKRVGLSSTLTTE